jgi:transcription antitermination factor NusG
MGKPIAKDAEDDILDLGSWCILRMASADTLRVLRMLKLFGMEVWTPVEKRLGRMPKTRARFDKEFALMPSYIFAHVEHMDQLLRMAMVPTAGVPRFSMFQHNGGIPLVADYQLDALRQFEGDRERVFTKARRRGVKGPVLGIGSEVKLPDGPFAGFTGIVEGQQGQFTLVSTTIFGKEVEIKVASLLLANEGENISSQAA